MHYYSRALMAALVSLGTSAALAQRSQEAIDLNLRLLQEAPAALQRLSPSEFCVGYGHALRMSTLPNGYDGEQAQPLMRAEAKRRRLRMNDKEILAEQLRIGMTRCDLLAAQGEARRENRSVGSWGEDIQYIYSRMNVYTRNGRVVSWQD